MAYPTGYSKYQEVTIDKDKVSADLTDFPVTVNLANLSKAGADIFDTVRTDGGDIRVTKADGTTQLPREIVEIDKSGKTGLLYFKFTGTLSSTVDTVIRIYYNGTDTEPASDSTYGSENVWNSNYKAVFHMNDASGGLVDSTSNGVSGVENGDPTYAQTGPFGGLAIALDGTGDFFNTASLLDIAGNVNFSYQIWVKSSDSTQDNYFCGTGTHDGVYLRTLSSTTDAPYIKMDDGSNWVGGGGSTNVVDGAWHSLHVVNDDTGNTYKGYADGGSAEISLNNSSVGGLVDTWGIGSNDALGGALAEFNISEFRFSATNLSADWIQTEYNNQSSTTTFYSTSDEVGGASPRSFAQII